MKSNVETDIIATFNVVMLDYPHDQAHLNLLGELMELYIFYFIVLYDIAAVTTIYLFISRVWDATIQRQKQRTQYNMHFS